MSSMRTWIMFLAAIVEPLEELYEYVSEVARDAAKQDAERERQLSMRLVRRAMDEAARREIEGP